MPTNYDLRKALVFCYHLKKTAAESYRMLVEAYGEHALGKTQFEDNELQALLDEDDTQTQQELADQPNVSQKAVSIRLTAMRKIQKAGKWVPHEQNERQQENRKF